MIALSNYSLADAAFKKESLEEQMAFFEFIAASTLKDGLLITPLDLELEETESTGNPDTISLSDTQTNNSEPADKEVTQ